MNKDKRIIFRLDKASYNKIVRCCCISNLNISEFMRDCLDYYFNFGYDNKNE